MVINDPLTGQSVDVTPKQLFSMEYDNFGIVKSNYQPIQATNSSTSQNSSPSVSGTSSGSGASSSPSTPNLLTDFTSPSSVQDGQQSAEVLQTAQVTFQNKKSFTDTTQGYRLGIDTDGIAKFYIGSVAKSLLWDGSNLTINGYVLSSKGTFGGDGSDGALSITSGTTTLSAANATIFRKNYSSISITGTAKLAFSNPNTNGTMIFLKSQGGVTITSSTVPAIDASGMGSSPTNTGNGILSSTNFGVDGSKGTSPVVEGAGGAGGVAITESTFDGIKFYKIWCGSAGGNGADGRKSGLGGSGGNGGGALIIECAGAYNVSSTITVAGINGGNGTHGGTSDASVGNSGGGGGGGFVSAGGNGAPGVGNLGDCGGGGGGGSGGTIIAMYNTLTSDTGTYTVSGGTHGTGFDDGGGNHAGNGGDGSSGYSLVQLNQNFA